MDRDRVPISSEVAQVLMDHLLHDGYEVGQRIPSERALAASLGVGRSVIREALKSLALLGLVQVRAGDGNYLQSRSSGLLPNTFEWGMLLDDNRIEEIIEARRELEVVLAGFRGCPTDPGRHRRPPQPPDRDASRARRPEVRRGRRGLPPAHRPGRGQPGLAADAREHATRSSTPGSPA